MATKVQSLVRIQFQTLSEIGKSGHIEGLIKMYLIGKTMLGT